MKIKDITIEITSKCPLHCLHCSSNAGPTKKQTLDISKIISLLQEAKELKGKYRAFWRRTLSSP